MKDWATFCKGCGQCCGVFPIPNTVFLAHQNKAQRPYRIVETDRHIIPVTDEGWCIFLDPGKRCAIYADRPNICRIYGVIKDPRLECSRMRGEPDDFIGETMSAREHATSYGIAR